ncbi:MAG: T9SS type A sorting domain-containing protein [Cytophagaceae bacterium]
MKTPFYLSAFFYLLINSLQAQDPINTWEIINQQSIGEQINNATSVRIGGGGNIFVGTNHNGVFQYDPDDAEWINHTMTSVNRIVNPLGVYVLTTTGMSVYSGEAFNSMSNVTPDGDFWNDFRDLAIEPAGHMWVATSGGLVVDSSGNDGQRFYTDETNNFPLFDFSPITAVRIDNSNRKWVGTEYGGIIKISSNGNDFEVFNTGNSALPSNEIYFIELRDNYLWIGTSAGLVRFNMDNEWVVYSVENTAGGIPSNDVNAILFHQNRVIVATKGGLAVRVNNEWIPYTTGNTNLPSNIITDLAVHQSEAKLYLTMEGEGVARILLSEIPENTVSIEQEISVADFNVYPNPVSNELTIQFNKSNRDLISIEIVTVSGETLKQYKIPKNTKSSTTLDVSSLSPGTYLLKIVGNDGVVFKKIIKS